MPLPRSTNNSLAAGVVSSESSNAGAVPVSSAPTPSSSLSADSIAEAVVRALGSSLPGILSSIQVNAPSSQASSSNPSTSTAVTSEVFFCTICPNVCRVVDSCTPSGCSGKCSVLARYVGVAAICFYFHACVGHHRLELGPLAGSDFFHVVPCFVC